MSMAVTSSISCAGDIQRAAIVNERHTRVVRAHVQIKSAGAIAPVRWDPALEPLPTFTTEENALLFLLRIGFPVTVNRLHRTDNATYQTPRRFAGVAIIPMQSKDSPVTITSHTPIASDAKTFTVWPSVYPQAGVRVYNSMCDVPFYGITMGQSAASLFTLRKTVPAGHSMEFALNQPHPFGVAVSTADATPATTPHIEISPTNYYGYRWDYAHTSIPASLLGDHNITFDIFSTGDCTVRIKGSRQITAIEGTGAAYKSSSAQQGEALLELGEGKATVFMITSNLVPVYDRFRSAEGTFQFSINGVVVQEAAMTTQPIDIIMTWQDNLGTWKGTHVYWHKNATELTADGMGTNRAFRLFLSNTQPCTMYLQYKSGSLWPGLHDRTMDFTQYTYPRSVRFPPDEANDFDYCYRFNIASVPLPHADGIRLLLQGAGWDHIIQIRRVP